MADLLYQIENGLAVDGIVGPKTWNALEVSSFNKLVAIMETVSNTQSTAGNSVSGATTGTKPKRGFSLFGWYDGGFLGLVKDLTAPFPAESGLLGKVADYVDAANVAKSVNTAENIAEGTVQAATITKVIGHYPEYIELSAELKIKPFTIPTEVWNKMTPAQQWAANQKFLDRAISKGAEFVLATPLNRAC